ncbi:MAG TPA: hypothetical protein VFD82_07325 [Planctomycetota bacterium]|nr:hypothetical protein [Planctomycetota bacterium]
MRRLALVVLGVVLFAIGAFPTDVPEPNGHTLYLGVLGTPLARFRSIEIHEVTASVTRHELSHEWAIQFMSLSFVSLVAGIVLICIAVRPRRAPATTAA